LKIKSCKKKSTQQTRKKITAIEIIGSIKAFECEENENMEVK
jgi:hypothetical protein